MNLIQESFQRLFPDRGFSYLTALEYNRRLGDFNANIKFDRKKVSINLNLQWKDIDDEIKIGLIQTLLLKVFKAKKRNTNNIELYNNFVRNIHILTPKVKCDPELENSFNRVNEMFFMNGLEKPNLQWGTDSFRKLACYNFHNDTVTVSTIFTDSRQEVLDYLMYHELLHKHHKFKNKNGRSSFHNREFREAEMKYPYYKELEKEISMIIRQRKRNDNQKRGIKRIPKIRKSLWDFF